MFSHYKLPEKLRKKGYDLSVHVSRAFNGLPRTILFHVFPVFLQFKDRVTPANSSVGMGSASHFSGYVITIMTIVQTDQMNTAALQVSFCFVASEMPTLSVWSHFD